MLFNNCDLMRYGDLWYIPREKLIGTVMSQNRNGFRKGSESIKAQQAELKNKQLFVLICSAKNAEAVSKLHLGVCTRRRC